MSRGPVRHAVTNAQHLSGVRTQPPLQPAGSDGVQAVRPVRRLAGEAREQTGLSGAQPGDLPHLPHAPGLRLYCPSFIWDLISLIVVILFVSDSDTTEMRMLEHRTMRIIPLC